MAPVSTRLCAASLSELIHRHSLVITMFHQASSAMNRAMLILLCLTTFGFFQANETHADDTQLTEVNVHGTWKAKVDVAGQIGEPTFHLKQDGNKITGTYEGLLGKQEVTGSVTDNKLEFGFTTDQGEISFTGTITNDVMEGEAHYGDALSGKWSATRQHDVTGKWNARVDVGGLTGEPTFTLDQKANTITGKYRGSFGEHDVTGTVTGNKVEFGIAMDQGKVIFLGTIHADTMKGDATYCNFTGTWTANRERTKPEDEKVKTKPSVGDKASNVQKATFEYAEKNSQKLFLDRIIDTSSNATGKRPAIIYSVGGGWESGKRDDKGIQPFLNHLASIGYIVVSIDYRQGIKIAKANQEITKENGTDMHLRAIEWGVEDLFDATSYLLQRADEWNLDENQIVIMGGSAGATNSLVAEFNVANETELARAHLPSGFRYAGVISMAGAFWLKADTPLEFKSKPAPILFFHGGKDQLVTYDEIQGPFSGYGPVYYCRKFAGPDYPKWFVDYPEGDHVVSGTPMFDCEQEMAAFLQRMVKDREKISVHTIEHSKTPKTFGNFLKSKIKEAITNRSTSGEK
jgi:dienelactone hydrolase